MTEEDVNLTTAHGVLTWAYSAARDSILRQTVGHNHIASFLAEAVRWYEDSANYEALMFRLANERLRRKLEEMEASPYQPSNKHNVGYHTALKHLREAINEEIDHAPARSRRIKSRT